MHVEVSRPRLTTYTFENAALRSLLLHVKNCFGQCSKRKLQHGEVYKEYLFDSTDSLIAAPTNRMSRNAYSHKGINVQINLSQFNANHCIHAVNTEANLSSSVFDFNLSLHPSSLFLCRSLFCCSAIELN